MKQEILSLTDAAIARAKTLLAANADIEALRLSVGTKGCSGLSYELGFAKAPEPGDETIEVEGVTLYIDPEATTYLLGSEMDYAEDQFTSGFVFTNPNEKGRCGCGESFHV